jgi:hypothetical protein
MSLIATWFSEGRRAQHPPDPRYPLRILDLAARKQQRLHLAGANREPSYLLPKFRFCARVFVRPKRKATGGTVA